MISTSRVSRRDSIANHENETELMPWDSGAAENRPNGVNCLIPHVRLALLFFYERSSPSLDRDINTPRPMISRNQLPSARRGHKSREGRAETAKARAYLTRNIGATDPTFVPFYSSGTGCTHRGKGCVSVLLPPRSIESSKGEHGKDKKRRREVKKRRRKEKRRRDEKRRKEKRKEEKRRGEEVPRRP